MAYIDKVNVKGVEYDVRDSKKKGVYFVFGTQTAATGAWTGVIDTDALVDGLTVFYYLPYAGSGNATLNLTLSDGTTTGAVNCYYGGNTRLTTHYGAGNIIPMTYSTAGSVKISGTATTDNRWTASAQYNSTYNLGQNMLYNTIVAKSAISSESIIVGDSSGYAQAASGVTFDIAYPVLWCTVNIAANGTNYANLYTSIQDRNLATRYSSFSGTKNMMVFLIGTLSGTTFTIDSSVLTCTVPTSADGKVYIPVGRLGNNSGGANYFNFFVPSQPFLFEYRNGVFQPYSPFKSETAASGGSTLSLVTTGEKYTWNSKTSNTGTVTSVATGVGLTGGTITGSGTVKAKLKTETAHTADSVTPTNTASRQYAVGVDKSGYLSVNVPWTDTGYTHPSYTAHTTSAIYKMTNDATGHVNAATAATASDIVTLLGTTAVNRASANSSGTSFGTAATAATTTSVTSGGTGLPTAGAVYTAISDAFTTNDALVFKGTIGSSGATVTALPATHKQGWTYKVSVAGTYAGQACEVGDMIICVTDGTAANDAHWTVVQTNIDYSTFTAATGLTKSTANAVTGVSTTSIGSASAGTAFTIPNISVSSKTVATGSSGTATVLTGVKANGTVSAVTGLTTTNIPNVTGVGTAPSLTVTSTTVATGASGTATVVKSDGFTTTNVLTGVKASGTTAAYTGVATTGTVAAYTGVGTTATVLTGVTSNGTATVPTSTGFNTTNVVTGVAANGTAAAYTSVNTTASVLTGVKASGTATVVKSGGFTTTNVMTGVAVNGTAAAYTGVGTTATVLTGVKASGTSSVAGAASYANGCLTIASNVTAVTGVASNGTATVPTSTGFTTTTVMTGVKVNGTAAAYTGLATTGTVTAVTGVAGDGTATVPTSTGFGTTTVLTGVKASGTAAAYTGVGTTATALTGVKANGTATVPTSTGFNTTTVVKSGGFTTTNVVTGVTSNGTAAAYTGQSTTGTVTAVTGLNTTSVGSASGWSAGTVPTLGTAIAAYTGKSNTTVLTGVAADGTATAVTGLSTTSIGSASAGTAFTVPNISVTSKTVATGASGTATFLKSDTSLTTQANALKL